MASVNRRIVVRKLTSNFADAEIEEAPLETLGPNDLLVRIHWAGVNASDVNYIAGRYSPGARAPLYPGFEAIGVVVSAGAAVRNHKVGAAVLIAPGERCFAEYITIAARKAMPLPSADVRMLPLLVSGLTASIALEQVGQMKAKDVVVVTAAAGGTGLFAVQLAKKAGCTVVGTCSSDEKAQVLQKLGCDVVINYKKEDIYTTLKKHFPKGVDLVYESVGGDTFRACLNSLATRGRLVVIGFVSGYADQRGWTENAEKKETPLPAKLLRKSQSVRGFFLNDYTEFFSEHTKRLTQMVLDGSLQSVVDATPFVGLERVSAAVDFLYAGGNVGKVVVDLRPKAKL